MVVNLFPRLTPQARHLALALVAALAFAAGGLAAPAAADSTFQLMLSTSADRSAAVPLDGRALAGEAFIFVAPEQQVTTVAFYLDDPKRTGGATLTETTAPFDFAGGPVDAATAWDTSTVADGPHTITAVLTLTDRRQQVLSSSFTVGAATPSWQLLVSTSADRSSPEALAGYSAQGKIHIFVGPQAGPAKVDFWLDDPARTGAPRRTEASAPWDFAGGTDTAASPLDVGTLGAGSHLVSARLTWADGTTAVLEATFSAAAGQANPPPGPAAGSSASFRAKVDFSDRATTPPDGYLQDFGEAYGPRTGPDQGSGLAYGWVRPGSAVPVSLVGLGRNRVIPGLDLKVRTLIHMGSTTPGSWEMSVPVGAYTVTVGLGDPSTYIASYTLDIEDQNAVAEVIPSPTQPDVSAQRTVWVADGRLTLDAVRGTNATIQYVEIAGVADAQQRPRVVRTDPVNAAIGVAAQAGISAELDLPGPEIDVATLDTSTAQLVELATGDPVESAVKASSRGIAVVPVQPLEAGRWYRFTVTDGLKDTDGEPFLPWSSVFAAGAVGIAGGAGTPSGPQKPPLATPSELIFSGVQDTVSQSQSLTVRNPGTLDLSITDISVDGADASSFQLADDAPQAPLTIAPGASVSIPVQFAPPSSTDGSLSASLSVSTATGAQPALSVSLYGLSADGLEGSGEPPLAAVVDTLGHRIDVGTTELELGTSATPRGDEVSAQLFTRAGSGPVTITPVARYSPDGTVGFGWYLPGSTPTTTTIGTIADGQFQTLLPGLDTGSATSFDPGSATFGVFSLPSSVDRIIYSQDALNTGVAHAVRVYPAKDREGSLLPSTYLVGFEEATNGDYQDYLYLVTNVVPA